MDIIEMIENWGRLLTVKDLSGVTGWSTKTLYRYVRAKKLRAIHSPGGSIGLEPHETAEWLRLAFANRAVIEKPSGAEPEG